MDAPFFADPATPPNEESILAAVGRAAGAWRKLFDRIHAEHPDFVETWNYYRDGKSWLLKVTRKKQTIFWLSIVAGEFRVGFYFPLRLTEALLASGLSDECKAEIRGHTPTGNLRGVRVTFGPQHGIQDVMTLIELKKTLK